MVPYKEVLINTWSEFRDLAESAEYRSWAFRGQRDASWPLLSSLSRYLFKYQLHAEAWPIQEERILRIFRRKAYLYLTRVPEEDDSLQWLALMQHHGAPTRLLDFTWSPYVAAFFALEKAIGDSAVWAVFPPALQHRQIGVQRQDTPEEDVSPWIKGNYEKYYLQNKDAFVIIGEPHTMNERLIAQSGTFVMPGTIAMSIEQIISERYPEGAIVKFVLNAATLRTDALRSLYNMNITNATLFPDINGLARSMAYELEFHWAFNPYTMEKYNGFDT